MAAEQRRERGSPLKQAEKNYIEDKLRVEGLSINEAAKKYGLAESTLRNALKEKDLDYSTRQKVLKLLDVPDRGQFKEQDVRRFNILRRDRNTYFTGRENTLNALCQEFDKHRFSAVTLAISGLGGMGKTSTALEYAYRCLNKDDYPDYPDYKVIQFVRADTVEVLKYGYADIANALHLHRADPQNLDEAVQAVIRWMTLPEEAPWLLILDNADDPAVLDAFFSKEPQRHFGHVLITSRLHHFTGQIERVDIEALEADEGVTFLYRRTKRKRIVGSKEEQAAHALVAEMGGLPLALEQVAAYLTQGHAMPFADYLAHFRDQKARFELMNYAPTYGDYPESLTIWTTWQMSLARLEREHPETVDLLRLCAFLHPVGIPRELVIALLPDYFAVAGADTLQQSTLYNRLLNVLAGYSLIQRNLENDTHNIHILVQTVLRDSMPPEEQKQVCERVLTVLVDTFPQDDWGPGGRGPLHYPHAEHMCNYAEYIGMESEAVGYLLHHLGIVFYYQGRLTDVEPYYQRALALRRRILSASHPKIAEILNDLAVLYSSLNCFADAATLYQQALTIRQQAFPERHPDIAESLNNLGCLYCSQGQFTEAEPLLQKAVAMRQKMLPADHARIATSLNNLALCYYRLERFAEAETLYQQALEVGYRALPNDTVTAFSLQGLAKLYRDQGRFAEAEPRFRKALEIWQRLLPEHHLQIAIGFNNLANLYQSQGRYVEAEPLLRQVLTIRRKALPADRPDIAASLSDLAELYEKQRRFAEAAPLYQEALDLLLSTRGSGHDDYQAVLTKYQRCVAQMKNDEVSRD